MLVRRRGNSTASERYAPDCQWRRAATPMVEGTLTMDRASLAELLYANASAVATNGSPFGGLKESR
jgi:hypothetical protein